jgi:spore germination protein
LMLVAILALGLVTLFGLGILSTTQSRDHSSRTLQIAAWMPTSWDTARARASFENNLDILHEISPVWYQAQADGRLASYEGARDGTLVALSHARGVKVLPTINNCYEVVGCSPGPIHTILADPPLRAAHIQNILDEVTAQGYDGLDIDYESLSASDRRLFAIFIQDLAEALHARGRLLSIAVHPKTSEPGGWSGAEAQDWRSLGEVVDRFRVMTYGFCWGGDGGGCESSWNNGRPPGPVAPLWWVKEVLDFAKTQVAPAKIQMGVPFYGYDWIGPKAAGVTWEEVQAIMSRFHPRIHWQDRDSRGRPVGEFWFEYQDGVELHQVWFNDSRSVALKLELAEELSIGGIAIWRLGGEDPANWQVIEAAVSRRAMGSDLALPHLSGAQALSLLGRGCLIAGSEPDGSLKCS